MDLIEQFANQFSSIQAISLQTFLDKFSKFIETRMKHEFFFYFEEEDLVEEVQFLYGNEQGTKLEKGQYFYYFKDFAYHYLNENPSIENSVSINVLDTVFRSIIFFPWNLSLKSRGIFVLANPHGELSFENDDLEFLKEVLEKSTETIERIRLHRQLFESDLEISLINHVNSILDSSDTSEVFFNGIIPIVQNTLNCQAVIFLMFEAVTQSYNLEVGNQEGRDFWIGQTEFFRSLAKESENLGIFTESYGGKHFKGEKYGLDRLETALISPVDFYGQSKGVFILLNKSDQKNFTKLDKELIQIVSGYTKAVVFRSLEKNNLISLFQRFVSAEIEESFLKKKPDELFPKKKQEVTILFMDLNKFTSFSENSSPDQITRQLNFFFDEMTSLIVEYDGTLDKYLGDGVMAIFGAPKDLPNHAERAVECAIAMQNRMLHINATWKKENLSELTASVGINTGEAVVGTVGCDRFMDFTAVGDTVNVASRLSDQANDGSILIGESTWLITHHVLNHQKMSVMKLKGKKEEMQTYQIQSLKKVSELKNLIDTTPVESQIEILRCASQFIQYRNSNLGLDYINSEVEEIRATVYESLGFQNNSIVLEPLIDALDYEKSNKMASIIFNAIRKLDMNPVLPMLNELLLGLDEPFREQVLQATIHSKNYEDKRLLIALIKSLQDQTELNSSLIADLTNILYSDNHASLTDVLFKQIMKPNKNHKIATINAFGKIQIPQVAIPLIKIFCTEEDSEVLFQCAKSVAEIENPMTLKLLKHVSSEANLPYWQIFFNLRLSQVSSDQFQDILLQNKDYYVKYAALNFLKNQNLIDIEALLLDMLASEDNLSIKLVIAKCLRTSNSSEIISHLCNQYGKNPYLDQLILTEIGFRKAHQHIDIVEHALAQSENATLMQAIFTSGKLKEPKLLTQLLHMAKTADNANITATIMQQLGFFDSHSVRSTLIKALHSPIGRIRANAIDSLMNLNEPSAYKLIKRLLSDDNNRVRANAALACLKFGDSSAFQVLKEMSQSPNKWMRMSCLWAVYMSQNPESKDVISGLLQDSDYDVILAAINFLKKYS